MTKLLSPQRLSLGPTDGELLGRFADRRDEAAFRELVARYAPLVMRVCRRALSRHHDAEDAAQTTFLLLVRRAQRIRQRQSVGAWLHGAAYRISIRAAIASRRRMEVGPADIACENDPLAAVARRHEQAMLDEELRAMPRKYRDPLVLHYLSGKSRAEIAAELGTTPTIVKGRLQRGRDELRVRLALRGVGLLGALAAVEAALRPVGAVAFDRMALGAIARDAARTEPSNQGTSSSTSTGGGAMAAYLGILACGVLTFGVGMGVNRGGELSSGRVSTAATAPVALAYDSESPPTLPAVDDASAFVALAFPDDGRAPAPGAADPSGEKPKVLKYNDNKPDGRKSLGGSGEMVRFKLPSADAKVRGVRIHGSRYGTPQPPREDFAVHIVSDDEATTVHTEKAPYARFTRGDAKWVTLDFKKPVEAPEDFWVVLDFDAQQTKGVYVSYDTSGGGEHSRTGLPGQESKDVTFGGDWMVEVLLAP